MYGDFINAVIAFIILAAILYFLVILPVRQAAGPLQAGAGRARPGAGVPALHLLDPGSRHGLRILHP